MGDAAEGMVSAMERYAKPDPVNLGSSEEIKVRDLVYAIAAGGLPGRSRLGREQARWPTAAKAGYRPSQGRVWFRGVGATVGGLKSTIKQYKSTLIYLTRPHAMSWRLPAGGGPW